MADPHHDARLAELQYLSRLAREGPIRVSLQDGPLRQLVASLLWEGYVNDVSLLSRPSEPPDTAHLQNFENLIRLQRLKDLWLLLSAQEIDLRLSHKGRIRLSELQQAMKTGRGRDPTGLMLSKRHLDDDLFIALAASGPDSPVTLGIIDMNGLKGINDELGHDAGDGAINVYLRTISRLLGPNADGYRGDGGDEVFVVFRGCSPEQAKDRAIPILRQLGRERFHASRDFGITASWGLSSTSLSGMDAADLRKRADQAMYRAKSHCRTQLQLQSAVGLDGAEEIHPVMVEAETEP